MTLYALLQKKAAQRWLKTALFSKYAMAAACALLVVVSFVIAALVFSIISTLQNEPHGLFTKLTLQTYAYAPEEHLPQSNGSKFLAHRHECTHHTCLDIYRCGHGNSLKVYIYPPRRFLDSEGIPISAQPSQEYYDLLDAIFKSKYYEPDPSKACILIPSIDTLNQNRFRPLETSVALSSLSFWNRYGENHLIFNMVPGAAPDYNTVVELALGRAIVAGAGFDTWTYQPGFDISIPLFSPFALPLPVDTSDDRPWLLISAQVNIHQEYLNQLENVAMLEPSKMLVLRSCGELAANASQRCISEDVYHYPEILRRAHFCAVVRGARLSQPALLEALSAGCIPVVVADTAIMPFQEVIDWKRVAIFLPESDLSSIFSKVESISPQRRRELHDQGRWIYEQYLSSLAKIGLTTLAIIEDRIFTHNTRNYYDWNMAPSHMASFNPLFLPITAPKSHGFTAVILTYDRIEMLFTLINKLSVVPSLTKIIVLWNNQNKSPPPPAHWPRISKPFRVIRTTSNKLSNRFYPHPEIETEAILTIDDDIVMLTTDEIEFGYEVWREFPDRIVGFPSRTHIWDESKKKWRYESEWTNKISLVLTGAAFHHKYWSFAYTNLMPGNIKEWVDDHMNCEDIAMNFLVANMTGKAPIKVTPRKKFKCPECTNTENLSADQTHMAVRSDCIDRFSAIYGTMPLKSVEFRADPVLFKDSFPEKLKRFNDIGSL